MKLKIVGLTKAYKQKKVLDNVNFEVPTGNFYGIVGDNGAGKSTLFRIISGLEFADQGTIRYNGDSWNESISKEITYMSQIPLMMKTTVYNNIGYSLKIRKIEQHIIDERVNLLLEELDLFRLKDNYAINLSGGEAQKVAFARALIFEPKLLLMDEPTAHIDSKTIQLIEKMIRRRQESSHMTTLMITHNVDQTNKLFDKVLYMKDGSIL